MTGHDWLEIGLYFAVLAALTPGLGAYLARVFDEKRKVCVPPLNMLERILYRIGGVNAWEEMSARQYAVNLLWFNGLGLLLLLALQLGQSRLPLNPQKLPDVPFWLALNTAVSFTTNTNWQAYSGETTLGYFVQSLGLTVQNFLSAATGLCVLLAVIRGFTRQTVKTVGNFWSDLVRATVYVLLPLALMWAFVLASQGVVQSWRAYSSAVTPIGSQQAIPLGPAASQVAIKQLGTNGGGFFGANSCHPFENPTPLSNFLEMLAILLIPSSLVIAYGRLVGDKRQGRMIWTVMMLLLVSGFCVAMHFECLPNAVAGFSPSMEGRELRFGAGNSVLWSVATTCASNGSVNAMIGSESPLTGGIAVFNIMLGEVIFGGVGVGLTSMLVFVFISVFIAGLMVGRTPEYLGKKIEAHEIKMAMIAVLIPNAMILAGTALAVSIPSGLAGRTIAGPHGLSEILYAFTSASGNNGSAFAGLKANTPFYNVVLSLSMLFGRLAALLPLLAIAGSLVTKQCIPNSAGTLRTDTALFACILIGVILIVGALTFFPVLCLGPILEQMLLASGKLF